MKQIPLKLLDSDPRNSNRCTPETLEKLARNIERGGFYPPIVVRPVGKRYVIIDGHHRVMVLKRLEHKEANCVVWDVSEADAALYLATLNRLHGADNPVLRAQILDELSGHLDIDDLLALIPETKAEMKDLLALLSFSEEQDAERIQREIERAQKDVPVMLSFVMSKADADVVQATLQANQPEDSEDPSQGLLAICRFVTDVTNNKDK